MRCEEFAFAQHRTPLQPDRMNQIAPTAPADGLHQTRVNALDPAQIAVAARLVAVTRRLNLPIATGLTVEAAAFASVVPSAGLHACLVAFGETRPRSSAGGDQDGRAPTPSWAALDPLGESLRGLPRRCTAGRHRHAPSAAIHRLVRSPDMRRLLATLAGWIERARQRRRLASLPDRLLKDIGISRCDALQEARKPFWRS